MSGVHSQVGWREERFEILTFYRHFCAQKFIAAVELFIESLQQGLNNSSYSHAQNSCVHTSNCDFAAKVRSETGLFSTSFARTATPTSSGDKLIVLIL